MSLEDIEIDNIEKTERLLINKHTELTPFIKKSLNEIKRTLRKYEIDERLLTRINDIMYECINLCDVKDVEKKLKHLMGTFWE